MSETKHTPWKLTPIGHETLYICHYMIESENGAVASVWCPDGNKEQFANAVKLAAAPDMFEALVFICAVLAIREDLCDDSKFLSDARNRALASLAKARGEKEVTE